MRRVRAGVVGLLLGALSLGLVWLLGMRSKTSRVVSAQRRLNRTLVNPRQLKTAGRTGAYASVVRHTGRRTGRSYQTPVGAIPTDDGFVVALVYGSASDWVQNVLATRQATVVHEGVEYAVDRPEVVPLETVSGVFSSGDRWSFRVFGVTEFLRLHRVHQ
jgi:deazaflavin-dependent oxidoreductase (nitroreductase family)